MNAGAVEADGVVPVLGVVIDACAKDTSRGVLGGGEEEDVYARTPDERDVAGESCVCMWLCVRRERAVYLCARIPCIHLCAALA